MPPGCSRKWGLTISHVWQKVLTVRVSAHSMYNSRIRQLVAATLLVALVSGTGDVPSASAACRSNQVSCRCCCCCKSPTRSKSSCCRKAKPSSGSCICGRQGESPALPASLGDRRGSDDSLAGSLPLSHAAAMPDLARSGATGPSRLDDSSPIPPRLQTILCRWLI